MKRYRESNIPRIELVTYDEATRSKSSSMTDEEDKDVPSKDSYRPTTAEDYPIHLVQQLWKADLHKGGDPFTVSRIYDKMVELAREQGPPELDETVYGDVWQLFMSDFLNGYGKRTQDPDKYYSDEERIEDWHAWRMEVWYNTERVERLGDEFRHDAQRRIIRDHEKALQEDAERESGLGF